MQKTITLKGINVKPFEGDYGPTNKVGLCVDGEDGQEYWISGFMDSRPTWQKGDTVTVEVWQKGQYWNFKPLADQNTQQEKNEAGKIELLERKIRQLEKRLSTLEQSSVVEEAVEAFNGTVANDKQELNVDDIPFN